MFLKNVHNTIRQVLTIGMTMVFVVAPYTGYAANLLAGSSKAQMNVGDTATISLYVDTQSQAINNTESTISFSKDIVDVVSINTQGSIFGLWVEQPSFSNTAGTITFNGGVANPGYQGARGLLFSVNVKAKKTGSATFSFGTSAVRANDGLGTDVLVQKTGVTIVVNPAIEKPLIPEPVVTKEDPAQIIPSSSSDLDFFEITSSTHPDQSLWYASNNVDLKWPLQKGVTGIQMALDGNLEIDNLGKIEKPIGSRLIKGLKDGISYFHVRQVVNGKSSSTADFAIRVDLTSPVNTSARIYRNDANELAVDLKADDATSGVDYFQIVVDGEDLGKAAALNGTARFVFPNSITIGKHVLTISSYDFARNKQEVVLPIIVEPFNPPEVTITIKNILIGGVMMISGEKAGKDQVLNVFIRTPEQKLETYQVVTNNEGTFSMRNLVTTGGAYEIWVEPVGDMKDSMKPMTHKIIGMSESILYHVYKVLDIASPIITLMIFIFVLVSFRKRKKE